MSVSDSRRYTARSRSTWHCVWLAIAAAALSGCLGPASYHAAAGPARVLVARRGWHIDVGFATQDLGGPLTSIGLQFPGARYVFFGFGDERYVRSARHHGPALLAALWPGRGVMLVTALANTPAEAFGQDSVASLSLSQSQQAALLSYINDSFTHTADAAAPLRSGPYQDSLYYASSLRYSGLHTCNTWAAEALQRGGLPVASRGVVFAGQLWHQLRPLGRAGAR